MKRHRQVVAALLLLLAACDHVVASKSFRMRYMSLNIGNVSTKCWKSKVCDPNVPKNVLKFIEKYQPDIVLLSEVSAIVVPAFRESVLRFVDSVRPPQVCEAKQMKGSVNCYSNPIKNTGLSGPILPEGYDFECGASVDANGTDSCVASLLRLDR